ncbi:glycerol acyltransferase [Acidobacteria bacterium Mor1]|nr:glycerol acyltransferase [Acidobacteria bacterium Mor1]
MWKIAFFLLIVRPVVLVLLGLNVRHRERLPSSGPAIVVANHNSHLDTLVLMTLFPLRLLRRIRPVAAADYFLSNRLMAWFSRNMIGILPVDRKGGTPREKLLEGAHRALAAGDIVVLFPEGTRGEPESMAELKRGISHLAAAHPEIPVTPVFLHGLGKALPRGEALLVPFFCDVFVGEPIHGSDDRDRFMAELNRSMEQLADEGNLPVWE